MESQSTVSKQKGKLLETSPRAPRVGAEILLWNDPYVTRLIGIPSSSAFNSPATRVSCLASLHPASSRTLCLLVSSREGGGRFVTMKVAKKLLRSSRKILLRHRSQPPSVGEVKKRDKYSPPPSSAGASGDGGGVRRGRGRPKLAKNLSAAFDKTTSSKAPQRNCATLKNRQRDGVKKKVVNGRISRTATSGLLPQEDDDQGGRTYVHRQTKKGDKLNGRERNIAEEAVPNEDEEPQDVEEEQDDDEEEEEEEEGDKVELDDAWIKGLMQQYWKIRRRYEKTVETNGAAAFSRSCCKEPSDKERYLVTVDSEPPSLTLSPLHLNELPPTKNRQLAFLRNEHNHVVDRCPVISLESIAAAPPMQYWTLTEVNVIADDEYTLSHIPFLGDAEDDTDFCTDLIETFPDGIHGTKEGCGEYLNDFILYHVVKELRAQMPHLETRSVFQCVYDQFPNKASVQDLISMYPDLQIRFEPETIDKLELTNDRGELVANFSASRLLNSYEVLLCHKCFSYDCVMHNATINDGYGKVRRKASQSWRESGEERRPCSRYCYLHSPLKKTSTDSKKRQAGSSSSKQDITCPLAVDLGRHGQQSSSSSSKASNGRHQQGRQRTTWTPHEEAIFNMLISTGEERYCKIAKILGMCCAEEGKKTCQEVFEYASRTAPLSPRLEMLASPGKNAKKKNDSHRTFRAVKWASTNGKVENCCMYKPCNHEGSCKKENGCRCVSVENLCTKYCPCGEDCPNRFPGCRCAPGNCRTRQCQCYFASWECDPDICASCNCGR